jgi:hypothetical protein
MIFGSLITPLQVIGKFPTLRLLFQSLIDACTGYSIALAGLVLFKTSGGK